MGVWSGMVEELLGKLHLFVYYCTRSLPGLSETGSFLKSDDEVVIFQDHHFLIIWEEHLFLRSKLMWFGKSSNQFNSKMV